MTACYPWVVDHTWWRSRARPKKNYLVTSAWSACFCMYLDYGPARVYYFPCLSIFISVHRKSKGTVKSQMCLFLIFLFSFYICIYIYIYTGILLTEIRIAFFSILCYFILLTSIRNFVFINLDIFFTSVQKWFLHIQFLSKLMIL